MATKKTQKTPAKKTNGKSGKEFYKQWWFWVIIVVVVAAIGAGAGTTNMNNGGQNGQGGSSSSSSAKDENTVELGQTFTFDNLEITFGTDISFRKIDNQFSDHNGADVVQVPITVKNIKDETHGLNMFYYKIYGSKGTQTDTVSSYFSEESIDFGGELRPGASITKNLFFYYDGDGEYYAEFGLVKTEKTVKFNVKKQ